MDGICGTCEESGRCAVGDAVDALGAPGPPITSPVFLSIRGVLHTYLRFGFKKVIV